MRRANASSYPSSQFCSIAGLGRMTVTLAHTMRPAAYTAAAVSRRTGSRVRGDRLDMSVLGHESLGALPHVARLLRGLRNLWPSRRQVVLRTRLVVDIEWQGVGVHLRVDVPLDSTCDGPA